MGRQNGLSALLRKCDVCHVVTNRRSGSPLDDEPRQHRLERLCMDDICALGRHRQLYGGAAPRARSTQRDFWRVAKFSDGDAIQDFMVGTPGREREVTTDTRQPRWTSPRQR